MGFPRNIISFSKHICSLLKGILVVLLHKSLQILDFDSRLQAICFPNISVVLSKDSGCFAAERLASPSYDSRLPIPGFPSASAISFQDSGHFAADGLANPRF